MKTVEIQRAPGAPACVLWDGRRADHGSVLTVTEEEAAILREREPTAWIFKTPTKAKE